MKKSQLRQLEDLRFEIEKAKLELELQSIRSRLNPAPIKLDVPSFVRQSQVLSPRHDEIVDAPAESEKQYDLSTPEGRLENYNDELQKALRELKESSDAIAELQLKKRQSKSKEEKASIQALIEAGVKSNVDLQQKVAFIKKVRNQALNQIKDKPF